MDQLLGAARRLLDLRETLARLDGERASVQEQIATCVNELASAAVDTVRPPGQAQVVIAPNNTLPSLVLTVINHAPGRSFSVREIVTQLNIRDRRSKNNIRTLLARMARDGRVARSGYGRYAAAARS